ncbi:isocitrate lyase/phosphoenolpyruvate mutase family protein (plasmid) [Rhizobium sp. CB3171]|uniref:isocitrate lyase/phosphoenolpyruvate mutase family protein n=1 Tax=Rhizobium sp. CB3171 TaxID=3039157 RepID=UPI0024B06F29|nr:isocitrate lyase/phosphoenolpyruvate mutase family protein [Rhizobium sp. CB3171]WFU07066.1 isocitrate lyase/phosphoenolpyruvate mutase family protein [Rhizobium sp. CB3171]
MDQTVFVPKSIGAIEDPTKTLRDLISSPNLTHLMGAYDGLSALIATQAGFKAIWASGPSISKSLGYRDVGEASWTHLMEVVERMADASGLPILADGDSGFGNMNSARLMAVKLLQHGASGVCIDDKGFPKMNSSVGSRHPLDDIEVCSGRLKAIKDTTGNDLVLVARTEALIAGYGLKAALLRADAYANAGADAILIHSQEAKMEEVLTFAKEWKRLPIIIAPSNYYRTVISVHHEAGISNVIWVNHAMRAAVAGMRAACNWIIAEASAGRIGQEVATLDDHPAALW